MGKRARILVVDDNLKVRRTLTEILEKEGYVVETVGSGKQAIDKCETRFFNVVLIDIRLPDMVGTELIDRLKKTEPGMVRIIITGYPSLEGTIEAINRGADGYVVKPFEVDSLLAIIEKHLKKQEERMQFDEEKVVDYVESRVRQVEFGGKR